MGLMDKLKAAKSNLTGDWADLSLTAEPVARGGTLKLSSNVKVKSNAVSIEAVILEVRCQEIVEVRNVTRNDSSAGTMNSTVTETESMFEKEIKASGPVELAADSTSTYSGEIPIPASAPPAFTGRNARYEWQARARLDMKGNDPDSGWQSIDVA